MSFLFLIFRNRPSAQARTPDEVRPGPIASHGRTIGPPALRRQTPQLESSRRVLQPASDPTCTRCQTHASQRCICSYHHVLEGVLNLFVGRTSKGPLRLNLQT